MSNLKSVIVVAVEEGSDIESFLIPHLKNGYKIATHSIATTVKSVEKERYILSYTIIL